VSVKQTEGNVNSQVRCICNDRCNRNPYILPLPLPDASKKAVAEMAAQPGAEARPVVKSNVLPLTDRFKPMVKSNVLSLPDSSKKGITEEAAC